MSVFTRLFRESIRLTKQLILIITLFDSIIFKDNVKKLIKPSVFWARIRPVYQDFQTNRPQDEKLSHPLF